MDTNSPEYDMVQSVTGLSQRQMDQDIELALDAQEESFYDSPEWDTYSREDL